MTVGPGFGGRLPWGTRPALLVVDMMAAYFTPGSPLHLPDNDAVDACASLLAAARAGDRPVVHTQVRYRPGGADAGLFAVKVPALALLAGDTEAGRIVAPLRPRDTETVVIKQYASAFFGTSLASTLTAAGVDTVVIGGVSTSGCIRATATDALQHGFRPFVVDRACADRTSELHRSTLADLQAKYAEVISLADALDHL